MIISCEMAPPLTKGGQGGLLERRPFKQIEYVRAAGVSKDTASIRNPNERHRPPTRRPFKQLEFVGPGDEDSINQCTTRLIEDDGTERWHKNHGAIVRDVAIDDDGNVYEVGDRHRSVSLRKRRADNGNKIWAKDHGADLHCCAVCPDGGVVVGGEAGTDDYTIRKYSADGDLEWSAATAYPIVKICVDDLGAVAALDGRDVNYGSLVYAYDPAGVFQFSACPGGVGTERNTTAIAFGVPNGMLATGPFANMLYVGVTIFDYASFAVSWLTLAPSADEGWNDPPALLFSSIRGLDNEDVIYDIAIAYGNAPGSLPDPRPAVAAQTGAFVENIRSPDPHSINGETLDLGGTRSVAVVTNGDIYAAIGTDLRRFAPLAWVDPEPFGDWANEAEWEFDHGNTIMSCHANEAGESVLGGDLATI